MHNILLQKATSSNEKNTYIAKIADLGTACQLAPDEKLHDAVGTSGYTGMMKSCLDTAMSLTCGSCVYLVAPEVLDSSQPGYSFPADVFSSAVVFWELLQRLDGRYPNPLVGFDSQQAFIKASVLSLHVLRVFSLLVLLWYLAASWSSTAMAYDLSRKPTMSRVDLNVLGYSSFYATHHIIAASASARYELTCGNGI